MKLIITRPEPAASRTAEKLQKLGHQTIISPLMKIVDTGTKIQNDNYASILVTSTNALGILEQRGVLKQLLKIPLFAVGSTTAEKARILGFTQVFSAAGTALDLAELAIQQLKSVDGDVNNILYICGVDTTVDLNSVFRENGLKMSTFAVYKAVLVNQLTCNVVDCLRKNTSVGVLLYSTRSASQMASILDQSDLMNHIENTTFYAISEKVMLALSPRLQRQCKFSKFPDESSLIALIEAQ